MWPVWESGLGWNGSGDFFLSHGWLLVMGGGRACGQVGFEIPKMGKWEFQLHGYKNFEFRDRVLVTFATYSTPPSLVGTWAFMHVYSCILSNYVSMPTSYRLTCLLPHVASHNTAAAKM